jgi:hypothetical protein
MSININRRSRAKTTVKALFHTVVDPVHNKASDIGRAAKDHYEKVKSSATYDEVNKAFTKKYQKDCAACAARAEEIGDTKDMYACDYHIALWNYLVFETTSEMLWKKANKHVKGTEMTAFERLIADGVELRDITTSAHLAGDDEECQVQADKFAKDHTPTPAKTFEEVEEDWDRNVRRLGLLDVLKKDKSFEAKKRKITKEAVAEMGKNAIPNTPENRSVFLSGMKDAWLEDTTDSDEKTEWVNALKELITETEKEAKETSDA